MRRPGSRIRVAHLIPDLGMGGAERVLLHIATHVDRGEFESFVVSLGKPTGSEIEAALGDVEVPTRFLGKEPGFDMRMYWRINRALAMLSPDVVHTHRHVLRYSLPSIKARGIPTLHTLHNMAERETDGPGKLVHALAFQSGVRPVAISSTVAESARRLYGLEEVTCVGNTIPVEKYARDPEAGSRWREKHGIGSNEVVVSVVGRLSEQKNPALAIRAVAACDDAVKKRNRLVFAGTGPLLRSLQGLTEDLHLSERVVWAGVQSDVVPLLSASDVLVMCSDWEGTPLVVMEAMAAGVPVIATAVGAVPAMLEHGITGFVVPVCDCGALTKALNVMCGNPQLRIAMGAAARSVALERFGLHSMISGYQELYRSLASPCYRDRAPQNACNSVQ